MKLIDALRRSLETDEPQPVRAGRCEATSGVTLCAQPARWVVRGQLRCSEHKMTVTR